MLFIVFGILSYVQEQDLENALYQIIFGLVFCMLTVYLYPKLAFVRMNYKGLWVQQGREEAFYEWSKIKSIQQEHLIVPPLYRIRLQDTEQEDIVFLVNDEYVFFQVITKDLSTMGEFIKQKNHEISSGVYQ
jgi:hypothetical protein